MKTFTVLIRSFILAVVLFTFVSLNGCGEDNIFDPPVVNDSNVVSYNDLQPVYWRYGLNDTTFMGVNLYEGDLELSTSPYKDMIWIDYQNEYRDFYFRSGHMSEPGDAGDVVPGKETRFNFYPAYRNITQAQWDTLSVIPDTDEFLEPEDFTAASTADFHFLYPGQNDQPVYFFYLKGKYDEGLTNGKRVFGMMWVKDVRAISNPEGVIPVIDIKMNINGQNKFTK